jgi:uncharacterized protein YutE (UPF0331/DUF86 family)
VVDRAVLAARTAAIQEAVTRIRARLPRSAEVFAADRDARDIVVHNLFVALQECVSLASHWLADEGRDVPATYRALFDALAERGVLDRGLAARMGSAAGLRNLIAHRYGDLDWARVHAVASSELDDLLEFTRQLWSAAG